MKKGICFSRVSVALVLCVSVPLASWFLGHLPNPNSSLWVLQSWYNLESPCITLYLSIFLKELSPLHALSRTSHLKLFGPRLWLSNDAEGPADYLRIQEENQHLQKLHGDNK